MPFMPPWPTPHSLEQSRQLLAQILTSASLHSPPSATHLLKSLSASPEPAALPLALAFFHRIPAPSTFHYNSIILACSRHRSHLQSALLFCQMHRDSVPLGLYTFKFLFKFCGQSPSLVLAARPAHCLFVKLFLDSNAYVLNSLMQLYVEFGLVDDARKVFVGMGEKKDVVSWTTMIVGFVRGGMLEKARKLFDEMPQRNVVSWTSMISEYAAAMVSMLSACVELRDLELGRWVHWLVEEERISLNENLVAALVDM